MSERKKFDISASKLGTSSGMPNYVVLLGLIQTATLFIPEAMWLSVGINLGQHIGNFPAFVQHYMMSSGFPNSMGMFWCLSPITLVSCTALWTIHVNNETAYHAFLYRRQLRLSKAGKSTDYSLILGMAVFIVFYIWVTAIYQREPGLWGSFVPPKSRIAMALVHASAVSLIVPAFLTMIFTELRANLFKSNDIGGNDAT